MRTIDYSSQFKRDYKRVKKGSHAASLDRELQVVIDVLTYDRPLLPRHRDHALTGQYQDCRDCHLKPDLVLIYRFNSPDIIVLVRLGSHSELFK